MLTPDNYDAYKGRQRRQDEARKQFQTVARLEDDGSTLTDAQLADRVASLTGSGPAPEEVVRANRELFREADDKAWAEKLGVSAPITLAMASDPKSGPISRNHYDFLASIEQVAGKLVAASKAISGGLAREGGGRGSPSLPNAGEDVANEPATEHQQTNPRLSMSSDAPTGQETPSADDAEVSRAISTEVPPATAFMAARSVDAASTSPENPGVNADGVSGGDSLQTAVTAVPVGTKARPATAAPAVQGNQGVGIASAPEAVPPQTALVVTPAAVQPEPAAAAPATRGSSTTNTVDAPGGDLSQTARSAGAPAARQGGGLAIGGAEGFGLDDGLPPDSYMPFRSSIQPMPLGPTFEMPEIKLREDAPSARAALAEGIATLGPNPGYMVMAAYRDLIAKQFDIPQDRALDVLNGVADGSLTQEQALENLNYTPSPEREKLANEIANSFGLTEDEAKDLEERIKRQPYIPVEQGLEALHSVRRLQSGPKFIKYLLMATTDEELTKLTERMIQVNGNNSSEISAVRRSLYEQNAVDPLVSDEYFTKFIDGKVTESQLMTAMKRHGLFESIIEYPIQDFGGQAISIGNIINFLDYYIGMPETEEWKKQKTLIDDVLHLKGKSQSDFDDVYQRILNGDNRGSLVEAWKAMKEGRDPEDVSKMFPSYPLGDGAIKYGEEFVTPGWENSLVGQIGRATGPLVNAAAFARLAPIYLGLDAAAANHALAVKADADSDTIIKSDVLSAILGVGANLPFGKTVMEFTPLKKYAGGAIDHIVGLGTDVGMQVVQQGGQNVIAKWSYDKNRALLQDAGTAAAAGALLSGLKIGGGAIFGRVRTGVESYYARNAISEAQEAIRRDGVLKDMEALLRQNVAIVANDRKEIYDFVQQKVKGTPKEILYFRIETFEDSLVKAGIDPRTFVESLGGVTLGDFQEAAKTGGYVRVPLATYAAHVMGTKAGDALRENATFKPGDISAVTAEEFLKGRPINQPKGTSTAPPEDKPASPENARAAGAPSPKPTGNSGQSAAP